MHTSTPFFRKIRHTPPQRGIIHLLPPTPVTHSPFSASLLPLRCVTNRVVSIAYPICTPTGLFSDFASPRPPGHQHTNEPSLCTWYVVRGTRHAARFERQTAPPPPPVMLSSISARYWSHGTNHNPHYQREEILPLRGASIAPHSLSPRGRRTHRPTHRL